jgi:hypothetical protein
LTPSVNRFSSVKQIDAERQKIDARNWIDAERQSAKSGLTPSVNPGKVG